MKIRYISTLYALVATLLLITCVRETDFFQGNTDRNTLVVDGVFTDGPGPHIVRLTRPGDTNKQAFEDVRNAQLTLSDDAGNQYPYVETASADGNRRFYQLNGVRGIPGRTYTIDIRLANGDTYRSRPEKMPVGVPVDSVQVRGAFFTSNNADGSVVKEPRACAYAYATAPDQASGRYLRWEGDAVYIFNELPKIYDPFAVQHQCFVTNRISD